MPAIVLVGILLSEVFPKPYNSEPIDAEPMPAGRAAAAFTATEGFSVNVFAAEPVVQNPIAMTLGPSGELWIAENYTYAERSQRFDLSLRDRVVVLYDDDRDGDADRRVVFTDQVQMLTSVEVAEDGVWLMSPPRLLFIPDADHDAVPDGPAIVRLDGFDVAAENYHNFANGLRFGPDGWLYGRCGGSCPGRVGPPGTPDSRRVAMEGGIWRFHPQLDRFEILCHGTTNPWGHDWDRFGQLFFINTVNGHLWHAIPGAHYERPFTLDPNPYVYELIDQHADHYHFDTGKAWHESRDGAAADFGGGHAHSGMAVLKSPKLPATLRDQLVTWNFHGRRLNCESLHREGSGYVARHGEDRFFAADPFFRGMDLRETADGELLAIDWSDTGECHEHTGVHRTSGRVFRFAPTVEPAIEPVDAEPVDAVEQRIAMLFEQHRREPLSVTKLSEALDDLDERVRAVAVTLAVDRLPIDDVMGPARLVEEAASESRRLSAALLPLLAEAAETDESGLVCLALASAISRLPVEDRVTLAKPLVDRAAFADDHNLPKLVWYGLVPVAESDPESLAELAVNCRWPTTQRLAIRRLAGLIDTDPAAVDLVVRAALDQSRRRPLLGALVDGLRGWPSAPRPAGWDELVAAAARDGAASDEVRELSLTFGDGQSVARVIALIANADEPIDVRRSALESLVAKTRGAEIVNLCRSLLTDPRLNVEALRGLASSSDPNVAESLVRHYRRFRAPHRPKVIAALAARASFADVLIDAVEAGRIPKSDVTAADLRQLRLLGESLAARLEPIYGRVTEAPAELQQQIDRFKAELDPATLMAADRSRGRQLFDAKCATCHRMFGQGAAIGPDLTGADRGNLDYLLGNIVAPSSVVSASYRMSLLQLDDGRLISGLVTRSDTKTTTVQTTQELLSIPTASIEARRLTDQSPMPTGLLDPLRPDELRDLVGYLQSPVQVSLPRD